MSMEKMNSSNAWTISNGEYIITVNFNDNTFKVENAVVTETTTLTNIWLSDGSKKTPFTKGSSSWTLSGAEVTVGNGASYSIIAEYTTTYSNNATPKKVEKTFVTSSSAIDSGTAYSLSEGTAGFYFNFAGTKIDATVAVSNNVPTSVTFTEKAYVVSRALTEIKLHRSGADAATDIAFTAGDGEFTLGETVIEVGKSHSYYLKASYTVTWSDTKTTTETVYYILPLSGSDTTTGAKSGTQYSLVERSGDKYFYFDYSDYLTTTAKVYVTDGVATAVRFTEVESEHIVVSEYPKVALVNQNGSNVVAYFIQDATDKWKWTLSSQNINKAGDNNNTSTKYRIRVYTDEDSYVDYNESAAPNDPNYWLNDNFNGKVFDLATTKDGNFCVNFGSGTYYLAVSMNKGILEQAVISTNADDLAGLQEPGKSIDLGKVNMPLKEEDFAGGKVHYFVVGTRMGDWRLQPEWELQLQPDGTYGIDDRLLYTSMMGIAMVDNYEDYTKHKYTFFVNATYKKSGSEFTLSLSNKGSKTAIRYNDSSTHGQFIASEVLCFEYTGSVTEKDGILKSTPTFVDKIRIELNSENEPSKLTMSGISKDADDIAPYRTFSLVGEAIEYSGAAWKKATPLQLADGYGVTSWQEAYIQYDEYGMPYVDYYGNTIYQTCFQPEWLAAHPTKFKATDGFEYDSNNMVLTYRTGDDFTHDNQIYTHGDEIAKDFNGGHESTEANRTATDGWQCYVLENMWLGKQFKVWTGWGGANKQHDEYNGDDGDARNARWYYDNGGHATSGTDWSISANPNTFYATQRDVNGADYSLGDKRIFARYVKLWWDPNKGFDGSFIQLITEDGGPQITCKRVGKHNLSYSYEIPDPNGQLQNYIVKSYTITRYLAGEDGKGVDPRLVESAQYAESDAMTVDKIKGSDILDPNEAEGGTYFYKIIVEYYANDVAGYTSDFSRDAESNRVVIYYDTVPHKVSAVQLAYNDAAATILAVDAEEAAAADEMYWSFDLRLTANAPLYLRGVKVSETDQRDVLSLVDYYVVGIPKHTDTSIPLYTDMKITYLDGTTYEGATLKDGLTYFESADDLKDFLWEDDLNRYTFDTMTYFGVAPDADNDYAMPVITFKNVIPGNYTLYVSMGANDTDLGDWAEYNVASKSASVNMYVPETFFSASAFAINPVDETAELVDGHAPMGIRENQPMKYHKSNKLSTTDGKFVQLPVTNSVLNDWAMTYTVKMTDSNDKNVSTYTLADITGKALNAETGVKANFDYLPIPYSEAGAGFATGNATIDAIKSRRVKDGNLSTTTTVAYKRVVTGYETDVVATTKEYSAECSFVPTKLEHYEALAAYEVNEEYSHQIEKSYDWENNKIDEFSNAFASLTWEKNTTLNNAAGYYAASTFSDGKLSGYTVVAAGGGYETKPFPAEGGEVTYGSGYDENPEYQLPGFVPGDEDQNFAEAAAAAGKLPIKVWYVGDGNAKPECFLYVALTADYPVLVNPTLTATLTDAASVSTMSLNDGVFEAEGVTAKMITLSYPQVLDKDMSGTTTETIDIAADGASDFRIYPNPAVDVINVAASAELGTIEIYSIDGRLVKVIEVDDTRAAIEVGDLAKGNYIVRAAGATQRMIKM